MPLAPPPADAAVFEALPVATLIVDADGRVRRGNPAAEQLLVRSERAMEGRDLAELLTLPAQHAARVPLALFDGEFRAGSGEPFRADLNIAGLPDRPGWRIVTLHLGGGARQLPGGSPATRAAVGAAAMLAHEIKNPLSGIRGAAQLLAAGAGDDAHLTTLITDEVDRIAVLIDRMQDFTDTRPLALVSANVHPVIDHVRRLGAAGFAADVAIAEAFDPSLPPALIDRDALVQVLLNLFRNAVEAGAGTIRFSSAYRTGLAVGPEDARRPLPIELAVSDDGPGVPADIADQLFAPFVSGKPEGRGLGLALVEKLVGQMGGVVHHDCDDGRTVFRILLARGAK